MRVSLFFAAACCAAALRAAPACPILGLKGWQPQTDKDSFLQENLGLSSEESFSVVTRFTLPKERVAYAAVMSLGTPDETQFTLTVQTDGKAYLSSAAKDGGTNALFCHWDVPTKLEAAQTYTVAMVSDAQSEEVALWLNGEKQALTVRSNSDKASQAGEKPWFLKACDFPAIRLSGRMYGNGDTTHNATGAVYDCLGVFGFALTEAQIKTVSDAAVAGESALFSIVQARPGFITVDLSAGEGAIQWNPEWNGKTLVLSGSGTLELKAPATRAAAAESAATFAPAALLIAPGARLTLAAPMGTTLEPDTLWVGQGVELSANFTATPHAIRHLRHSPRRHG